MVETQGSCRGRNAHFCHVCSIPAVTSLQALAHLRRSSVSVCTPIHDFYGRDHLLRATILIVPSLIGCPTSSTDSLTLSIPPDTAWKGGSIILRGPSEVEENPGEKVPSLPYFDLPVCQSRSKKLRAANAYTYTADQPSVNPANPGLPMEFL